MDKFYKSVPKNKLKEAGYISEKFNLNKHLKSNSLLTPTFKIKASNKNLILLSTGSFSPAHNGHVEMLEEAKRQATALGYNVVGGYLSPSHDAYLRQKLGKNFISLPERIQKLEELLSSNSWIMIDKFEAFLPAPCNFTSVIIRLENFLQTILPSVEIAYVYGSDNQSFGYAFDKDGLAFCIERDNYPISLKFKNVINCPKTKFSKLSSTLIRSKKYLIRQEEFSPISKISYSDYVNFCQNLKEIFANYFPSELIHAKTRVSTTLPTISLDSYFKGDFNLKVSRQFSLDSQAKPVKLIARPGSQEIKEQVLKIPKGDYCLVDDDKASGTTVALAKQILAHCNIKEEEFLIDTSNAMDIVDGRDFLFGATDGGLVIEDKGVVFRSPYIFPFVNLTTRASIPTADIQDFSKNIIKLNLNLFKKYHKIKILDLHKSNQAFFKLMGFEGHQTVLSCIKKMESL